MKNTVKVNDVIKSFDFPGRTDCYIVGQVTSVKDGLIIAKVIRSVSEGKDYLFPVTEFSTYEQGLGMFDDSFNRVVVLG
jgi:hypothetical protein